MKGVSFIPGLYVLIVLVQGSHKVSSASLDNLTNVLTVTPDNFDEQIANKNLFVLLYESR